MSISVVTLEEGKRYHVYVSAGTDAQGKRVRVSERFAGTKSEANRRARAIAGALDTGSYVRRRTETFGAFVDAWLPTKLAALAPTTGRTYLGLLRLHIRPVLDRRPIQKITPADLTAVFAPLVKAGKVRTADHCYLLLTVIFNAALKRGALGRNPLLGVERPKVARHEMTVLGPADWQRVREYLEARDSWVLRIISLLLTLGCRRSELCGLQWSDVDFDRSLVYIRRSYHVVNGVAAYQEPKSARSRRAIALDSHSVKILADQRADAERLAGLFGRPLASNAPIFARADGRPLHPEALTSAWVRVARALNLNVRLHDLRHSSATLMLSAGIPVQLVSQRLGHATAGFTLTQYAGVLPGAQVEAAEKLAALLNGQPKASVPALAGTTAAG